MLTFSCSEENVYLLCKTLCENGVAEATCSDLFVVFISNEKKQASLLLFINNSYLWSCFMKKPPRGTGDERTRTQKRRKA